MQELSLTVATNYLEWCNAVKYTEASALFCACSHEVTCIPLSVLFFWRLFAEGGGSEFCEVKYGHCVLCLDQGRYSGVRSDSYVTVCVQCGLGS